VSSDKQPVLARLKSISASLSQIQSYTKKLDKQDFLINQEKIDAVCMRLTDIGENIYHLEKADFFEGSRFDLPWHRMSGLRHILSHSYSQVDPNRIWSIVENDLDDLQEAIDFFVRQESKGQK
jgi:uncharacterized protein with HEPN domain